MKKILIPAVCIVAIFIVLLLILQLKTSSQMGRKIDIAEEKYPSGVQYMEALKNDMAKYYQNATGQKVKNNCLITLNENYKSPNFCTASEREDDGTDTSGYIYVITLTVPIVDNAVDYIKWGNNIFELGHEMTHYVSRDYNHNNDVDWIEETICEAMALHYLNYYIENWKKTDLSRYETSNRKEKMQEHFDYQYDRFKEAAEKAEYSLSTADENAIAIINEKAMKYREYRVNEMHELYALIKPEYIKGLVEYRDYTDGLFLKTDEYKNAFPDNPAVAYLCDLSDGIKARTKN